MDKDFKKLIKNAENAAEFLKCLGHTQRLLMVCYIGKKERTVGEIEKLLGVSQSSVSQHLTKLRDRGILKTRRDTNHIYYSILNEDTHTLISALTSIYCK